MTIVDAVPWLSGLPLIPKSIVSVLIVGVATFLLVVIWMPSPDTALQSIVDGCYRRAVFTRMHAQLNADAMFASIGRCRETLQKHIPAVKANASQALALELLAAMEAIERRNPIQSDNDKNEVNKLKLSALGAFRQLASTSGKSYPLPAVGKLGESAYFTEQEADAAPSLSDLGSANAIDPATGEVVSIN